MDPVQPPVKRRYDVSKRREAAANTRKAILDAALELFADRGYAATPMTAIAGQAGVALDTVYASVGRKPQLARLLIEAAISGRSQAVPAEERDYVRAIQAAPDAGTKIAIYASAMRMIAGRLAPVLGIVQQAAPAEPELAALWREIAEGILFQEGDIVEHGEEAEEEAVEAQAAHGAPLPGSTSLGIGSLRGAAS